MAIGLGISILVIIIIALDIYSTQLKKNCKDISDKYEALNKHQIKQIEYNQRQEASNRKLQEENNNLEKKKSEILKGIKEQDSILKSLTETAAKAREDAESIAEKAYKARERELLQSFETNKAKATQACNEHMAKLQAMINQEQEKLDNLQKKQLAYIEAERRKQEMEDNQDFYKLQLSSQDESDIEILRDMECKVSRKDAIDKIIYEVYYRPAFNALTGRVIQKDKVCGIYKITSCIDGLSYIGQSVDIKERWKQHIKNGLAFNPGNNKLYQALRKQGPQSFTFEILEEVSRAQLNKRETYWIDFYKTKDFGLNSTKGGS